jgi:glycyl-tRNA synthetase beta chain
MKSIRSWEDLSVYGIVPLTGEACGLSYRILCDVTAAGKKIIEKAGPQASWKLSSVKSDLFTEAAERDLYAVATAAIKAVEQQKRSGKYRQALQEIAALRPAVDRFFQEVMVMAEDENVRKNRLSLLAELLTEFSTIADFSEIVTPDTEK